MAESIPHQHPAVVLRSQYVHLRTLLAVAMIAVVALAAVVVILAIDDGNGGSSSAGAASEVSIPLQPTLNRYDGGPEEGTSGEFGSPRSTTLRYDGGPEEGTRGPGH